VKIISVLEMWQKHHGHMDGLAHRVGKNHDLKKKSKKSDFFYLNQIYLI